jgi:hypothetical protein
MKIGFLFPATFGIGNPDNGVLMQARCQANALRRAGHDVVELNPWDPRAGQGLDVVQFFQGGYAHHQIQLAQGLGDALLVFAPIIDSNEPNWRYRIAARLGQVLPKVNTAPGVFADQAAASGLVVVRSKHELSRLTDGLGVDPAKVRIALNGIDPPKHASADRARR